MKREHREGLAILLLAMLLVAFFFGAFFYVGKKSQRLAFVISPQTSEAKAEEAERIDDPTKGPTAWGQQVAKAMKFVFEDAQAGIITAGELMSIGPNLKQGELIPWENIKDTEIVLVEISGAELISAVALAVKYYPRKNASFLQLFGLKALCIKQEEFVKLSRLTIGDEPINPEKTYKIAMTRFMAEGGGPFAGLESIKIISEVKSLNTALRKLLFPVGRVGAPEPTYLFAKE